MDDSPLNDIPAEIRIKIYEAVLLVPDGIRLEYNGSTNQMETGFSDPAQKRDSFALIATSKQVRQETLPVLFGYNTIRLVCITFNNAYGISDVALAQETTSALSRCSFTPYMKRVRIQLGCWMARRRERKDQAIAAASETLKHFARAFPSPKVRLECHFSVMWIIISSLCTKREKDLCRSLYVHISRGKPNSLIESIQRETTERYEVFRQLAGNREQALGSGVKNSAAVIERFAQIMAADPMWLSGGSSSGSAQNAISYGMDREDEGDDDLQPTAQGKIAKVDE